MSISEPSLVVTSRHCTSDIHRAYETEPEAVASRSVLRRVALEIVPKMVRQSVLLRYLRQLAGSIGGFLRLRAIFWVEYSPDARPLLYGVAARRYQM